MLAFLKNANTLLVTLFLQSNSRRWQIYLRTKNNYFDKYLRNRQIVSRHSFGNRYSRFYLRYQLIIKWIIPEKAYTKIYVNTVPTKYRRRQYICSRLYITWKDASKALNIVILLVGETFTTTSKSITKKFIPGEILLRQTDREYTQMYT